MMNRDRGNTGGREMPDYTEFIWDILDRVNANKGKWGGFVF
jgi:hypothetical protein